jgi:hypothetical protein
MLGEYYEPQYYTEEEVLYDDREQKSYDSYEDEDYEEYEDYAEEKEEEKDLDVNEFEEKTFEDQFEDIIEEESTFSLDIGAIPFALREQLSGPLTSMQQIKMLYAGKGDKIDFSQLSDEDFFKILVNIGILANKINILIKNVQYDMEKMFTYIDKIPSIKYKNPLGCLLGYLCVNIKGEIMQSKLEDVFIAAQTCKLLEADVLRYARLWQTILKQK